MDDKNPNFLFQLTSTELLVKIVSGEINAKKMALKELDNRYLDKHGNWKGTK